MLIILMHNPVGCVFWYNGFMKNLISKRGATILLGTVLILSALVGGIYIFNINSSQAQAIDYCPGIEGNQDTFNAAKGEIILSPTESIKVTGGLVQCGRACDNPDTPDINESDACGFCSFFSLFDKITSWIIWTIAPIIAGLLFVIGGLAIATSRGSASQLTRGKDILLWTFIGYAVILIGWLVLNSFFTGMGLKTWTGLTGENGKITLVNTASPTSVTFTTDKTAWEDDELNGLAVTITKDIMNPQSVGESKKIIDTIDDSPKDKIETGLWTNTPGVGAEFKIGGWWQFSCE